MMKILVVNESSLLRDFMTSQLNQYGFSVIQAINGLDGWTKLKQNQVDLVIMDYSLTRKSSVELLQSMGNNPNTLNIPVILTASALTKDQIPELAKMGVRKILSKPVRIDALVAALNELLDTEIQMDQTPCILDAHLNDQILFIEIAQGLNREKISLLRYKIAELLRLYSVHDPRILILLTDIQFREPDRRKLGSLIEEIITHVRHTDRIRILTVSEDIKVFLSGNFSELEVSGTLEDAMNGLLGIRGMESLTAEQDNVQARFFTSRQELHKEAFQLNFENESSDKRITELSIAVVTSDLKVREVISKTLAPVGGNIDLFPVSMDFVDALSSRLAFDLVFLDMAMPDMNGLAVLRMMEGLHIYIPTVILAGVSLGELLRKASEHGASHHLLKPLQPRDILSKAAVMLKR